MDTLILNLKPFLSESSNKVVPQIFSQSCCISQHSDMKVLAKKMQRKESCLNDLKQKFLTNTCSAFCEKGSSFSDTLIRKTLFFSNIPIALSPKLTRFCIIISGFLLKGLFYTGETGVFEIDDESQAEIYVIYTKKLFKKKSKHSLFIYRLNTFIEKEKILSYE